MGAALQAARFQVNHCLIMGRRNTIQILFTVAATPHCIRRITTRPYLKTFAPPDLGNFDLLAAVIPKAKERKMQSYCWLEDVYNPRLIPNFEKVAEVDIYGKRTAQACLNNPDVREF